jgi:hypothetical protein
MAIWSGRSSASRGSAAAILQGEVMSEFQRLSAKDRKPARRCGVPADQNVG